ncbi:hypothetical protein GCK72_018936 [Caenorhabditis remanei]|uniref:T20D4.11-like domain-containing protein n=1 Tax=Caenorhabditis remanei TaxID=31234 RepID=A0A6A5GCD1_CAERE|nr:hypothetical protein GCK72_018936 [Caenorhabditis remanei]KAF1752381.1 hypothetical protein GCK72_018936 [Caenorhabditis remanei]
MDKKENLGAISNFCVDYQKCAEPMKCQADEKTIGRINKILVHCEVIQFRHRVDFSGCADKLNAMNTTCYREWNPFPQKVDDSDYMGKDNCLEGLITGICGADMWKKHKEHYLSMNEKLKSY